RRGPVLPGPRSRSWNVSLAALALRLLVLVPILIPILGLRPSLREVVVLIVIGLHSDRFVSTLVGVLSARGNGVLFLFLVLVRAQIPVLLVELLLVILFPGLAFLWIAILVLLI